MERKARTHLGDGVADLADPIAMHDVRRDLGLGRIPVWELTYPNDPGAIEAKVRIRPLRDARRTRRREDDLMARGHASKTGGTA